MATPNLFLELPIPTQTLGPTWATQLNAALEVIDIHDHSSGKGVKVPTAGLNINAALDFNNNAATSLELANFQSASGTPSGAAFSASVSVSNGDLFFTNLSGVPIQITSGGALVSSPGAIQSFDVVSVSTDINIVPSDTFVYLIVDTTAPRNITLPLSSSVSAGRIYIIKDASGQSFSNNITITASGSDEVDGQSTYTINSNFSSTMIVGDGGVNWYVS